MKGSFNHIAATVKGARENHRRKYSQTEISHLIGYLNGQFISNVERGVCSLPVKKVADFCKILNVPVEEMKEAMMKDFSESFDIEVKRRTIELGEKYDAVNA